MRDNFVEYGKWLFEQVFKEDSAISLKFSLFRSLWDLGKD